MSKITFNDKTNLFAAVEPDKQITSTNVNEIKNSVNDLYDAIDVGDSVIPLGDSNALIASCLTQNILALNLNLISEFTNNATAIVGGLVAGDIYRTGDILKIVH